MRPSVGEKRFLVGSKFVRHEAKLCQVAVELVADSTSAVQREFFGVVALVFMLSISLDCHGLPIELCLSQK